MNELTTTVATLPITVTSAATPEEVQDHLDNWASNTDVAGNFAVDGMGDFDVVGCTQTDDRPFHHVEYGTRGYGHAPLTLTINDGSWEAMDDQNPTERLYTTIVINGLSLFLEAWAVTNNEHGVQVTTTRPDDLDLIDSAFGGDGAFHTLTIRGREYVLVASPYRN